MLQDAKEIAAQFTGRGSMWQNPFAQPDPRAAVQTASVWFSAYPISMITRPGTSFLASLADPVSAHMGAKLPQIGAAEPVSAATEALEQADALLVVEGGKPAGVITRQDLLGHLSHRAKG